MTTVAAETNERGDRIFEPSACVFGRKVEPAHERAPAAENHQEVEHAHASSEHDRRIGRRWRAARQRFSQRRAAQRATRWRRARPRRRVSCRGRRTRPSGRATPRLVQAPPGAAPARKTVAVPVDDRIDHRRNSEISDYELGELSSRCRRCSSSLAARVSRIAPRQSRRVVTGDEPLLERPEISQGCRRRSWRSSGHARPPPQERRRAGTPPATARHERASSRECLARGQHAGKGDVPGEAAVGDAAGERPRVGPRAHQNGARRACRLLGPAARARQSWCRRPWRRAIHRRRQSRRRRAAASTWAALRHP